MRTNILAAVAAGLAALGIGLTGAPAMADDSPAFPYGPLPVCHEEDGSDIDGYCIWINSEGEMFLNPTPEEMKR